MAININVYHENTVSNTRICKSIFSKTGLVALPFSLPGIMERKTVTPGVFRNKQVL